MAKLISIICLGLLCVALASGFSMRGSGGRSHGGNSQGGNSQGGSSSEKGAEPITMEEFKGELKEFSDVFKDASKAVGETEDAVKKARASQTAEDWIAAIIKFVQTAHEDLSKLDPAFESLGHLLERIAESPDVFPPLPYCDSSFKLAHGKTAITTDFEDARQVAFLEDLGCFKDKILKAAAIDFDALKQNQFTELQAIQQYMTLLEEALQLDKAFERFGEALEMLHHQSQGGSSKRSDDANADIAKLVRLLKQLNVGARRK